MIFFVLFQIMLFITIVTKAIVTETENVIRNREVETFCCLSINLYSELEIDYMLYCCSKITLDYATEAKGKIYFSFIGLTERSFRQNLCLLSVTIFHGYRDRIFLKIIKPKTGLFIFWLLEHTEKFRTVKCRTEKCRTEDRHAYLSQAE